MSEGYQKRDALLALGCFMLVGGLVAVSPWLLLALFGALFIAVWWRL